MKIRMGRLRCCDRYRCHKTNDEGIERERAHRVRNWQTIGNTHRKRLKNFKNKEYMVFMHQLTNQASCDGARCMRVCELCN